MKKIILAFGGNLGDVQATFDNAIAELKNYSIVLEKRSSVIETEPLDCKEGDPNFFNMVALFSADIEPLNLLEITQAIEVKFGRDKNHEFHAPRTLDIDIIAIEGVTFQSETLIIPHKETLNRSFVMEPIRELIALNYIREEEFPFLYINE